MSNASNQGRIITTLFIACAMAACAGEGPSRGAPNAESASAPGANGESAPTTASAAPASEVGVEPGPVEHSEGPAAVLAAAEGAVEVRRLGAETFVPSEKDQALFLGDQVRAGDGARATILFADESTAELAEVSTLAIGSRVATADPASSAAVLSGVARFSVSPRAPGEGPFMVFAAAGVIATKGTVFGVGVAADGDARVGVETGAVEVAGAAELDAPLTLDAAGAVDLSADGKLATPVAWAEDDWGVWRDGAEADIDVAATAALHADAMKALAAELEVTYGALADLGGQVAAFEADAAAAASADQGARYGADLPAAAIAIDASFLAALRLEYLTHAHASRAVLGADLYVRHPQAVVWTSLQPHVQAAVLWPKRFDAMAVAYFEPLRVQYYLHHPRGRAHAHWVGVAVPSFYAAVTPPELPSAKAKLKLKFKVFTPPAVKFAASARALWIAAPSADWHARAKLKLTPPRGKLAFWVRPPQLKAKAMLGAKVKAKIDPKFALHPPKARGRLDARWAASFGHEIKVTAPDLRAAAEARAKWKAELTAPDVDAAAHAKLDLPRTNAKAHLHGKGVAGAKLDARAKLDAAAKAKADAKAKLDMKAKLDGATRAKAEAKAKLNTGTAAVASLKLKAPQVKAPKAPKAKAEAKGSASFKLGN